MKERKKRALSFFRRGRFKQIHLTARGPRANSFLLNERKAESFLSTFADEV